MKDGKIEITSDTNTVINPIQQANDRFKTEVESQLISESNSIYINSFLPEIIDSEEFVFAVMTYVIAETAHNDHNQFQNTEAANILDQNQSNFEAANYESRLGKSIKLLAEKAASKKSIDAKFSYFFDTLRVVAASVIYSFNLRMEKEKGENHDIYQENALKYSAYAVASLQVCSSLFTSYFGYQTSICGHFAEEAAKGYEAVIRRIISLSAPDSTTHHQSSSSKFRGAGTFLNISSIAGGGVNSVARLHPEISADVAIAGVAAPILSSSGKTLSVVAANKRKEEVANKINEASQLLNEFLKKNFHQFSDEQSKTRFLGKIIEQLQVFSVQKLNEAQTKRESRSVPQEIFATCKYLFAYAKDSLYGISYNMTGRFHRYKAPSNQSSKKVTKKFLKRSH